MSRQTPNPAPEQYAVLEPGDTYECGPLYIERDTVDTRRRALIEARCEPPPEERTQPDDLKQLDLLRIAVNSFAFNQQPRRYGSRFARHQAESARATASIAALLADGALLRTVPPPAQTPSPAPPPGVDIRLGGAGIVAAGAMLPALMQLFDRKAVDRDSHLQRLEFIGSRYLPRCRETLLELGLDEASKLFEEAVDPVEFRVRVTDANAISTVVYREIARQCALGLQALFVAVRDAPLDDHAQWAIEADAFPQAPAAQAEPAADATAGKRATRKRTTTRRGKTR